MSADSSYNNLILGIISTAAEDYRYADKLMANSEKMAKKAEAATAKLNQKSAKAERKATNDLWIKSNQLASDSRRMSRNVEKFVHGMWFIELCELVDLDPDRTKKAILEKWGKERK